MNMDDFVKACAFAIIAALVAAPVAGLPGLLGVVFAMWLWARSLGLTGQHSQQRKDRRQQKSNPRRKLK